MVATVDGRITLGADRVEQDPEWVALRQRAGRQVSVFRDDPILELVKPQVNLTGSGTILSPSRTPPSPLPPAGGDVGSLYREFLPPIDAEGSERRGWFAVVDGQGRIRWKYKESDGWHLLVLVARQTSPEYLAFLRSHEIPYLVAGQERVDLRSALEQLAEKLGVSCVLAAGGGRLNGALLRAGLVDELSVVFLPGLAGGTDTPTLFDAPELPPGAGAVPLKLISTQVQASGMVWLRYEVVR